jgi:hypothetical protein
MYISFTFAFSRTHFIYEDTNEICKGHICYFKREKEPKKDEVYISKKNRRDNS